MADPRQPRARGSHLAAWRTGCETSNALRAERELAREGAGLVSRAEFERMQVELVAAFFDALEAAPAKVMLLLVAARDRTPEPADDAGDEVEP